MRPMATNLKIVSAADETELVGLKQPARPPSLPVFVHGYMCRLHVESTVCVCASIPPKVRVVPRMPVFSCLMCIYVCHVVCM